jgi:O-antigen chain-terminating methyltransferase
MNELEANSGESGRTELGRCLRRCDELEARLGHALEEQGRIRQGLQSRLLENQEAHRRELLEIDKKMEQEKLDLRSQLQEAQGLIQAIHTDYQQTSQELQSRVADAETTITALSQQVQDAKTTVIELTQQLQDAETTITALRRGAQGAQTTATELTQQLQDAKRTITAQSQQLVERQSDLKFSENQLNQVRHRFDSTLNELNGVYRSLSWRITAPLRWLSRPFHRQGAQ